MTRSLNRIAILAVIVAVAAMTGYAAKGQPIELGGVACQTPPPSHCPDADCPGPLVVEQGTAVEPKTSRKFFLDYPCDLKAGEKVTFILSLHGAGSYGNWQRNYFPLMDYKDKYRLVIATPNAPARVWAASDDEYLQNIVTLIYAEAARNNFKIKAFWLVGHSQGGMTSNRLLRTDFFEQRVDGWLSLSGGRIGGNPGRGGSFPGGGAAAAARGRAGTPAISAAMAALREPPPGNFSFLYETGRREMDDKGIPETSSWAKKLGCGARVQRKDVTDSKPGYVYDGTRQNPPNPAWGLLPRPGTAEVFQYPNCKGGRVVADVIRIDKGHTEGLEPHVTEELVTLMLSAKKK